ncbi:MAG: hypothetical protein ABSF23_14825 [Terracidiphilus sp.]|jgi:hypothetical protein
MAAMKPGQILLAVLAVGTCMTGARSGLAQVSPSAAGARKAVVTVPFVGCASDGQVGPVKAPTGKSKVVAIPAAVAQRLAYYRAEHSDGVLAPRGWHCFSTYGSSGANLFVSPDPIDAKMLFSRDWKGFAGQVIQISFSSGGTSGRFEVAKIVARVFPAYKALAENVIAEGLEPASDFPFSPCPKDKLTYRSKSVVEYETPANTEGLGTDSRLQMNASPIDGVAILTGEDTDLIQLSARLSNRDRDLIPIIIRQVESEEASPAGH